MRRKTTGERLEWYSYYCITRTESKTNSLTVQYCVFNFPVAEVDTPIVQDYKYGYIFLFLSSQQRGPDDGNVGGLQSREVGHEENIKEETDPGRKVRVNLYWYCIVCSLRLGVWQNQNYS